MVTMVSVNQGNYYNKVLIVCGYHGYQDNHGYHDYHGKYLPIPYAQQMLSVTRVIIGTRC